MSETITEGTHVKENKINVSGIAIRAGISRNRIKYTEETLKKFAPTMANRPILKDHNATVDNAVGLLTNSASGNGSEVSYSGWVKEDGTKLLEKIRDGRIKEVSIGAIAGRLVKESDDSDIMIAEDLVGLELSLTPTPGIVGTSISQTLESLKNGKKAYLSEDISLIREEEDEYVCKDCDKEFPSQKALDKHYEEEHKEKEEEKISKDKFNYLIGDLKKQGLLKSFNLSYEQYMSEVNKMDIKLQEELTASKEESKKLQEQVNAFQASSKARTVEEYKKLAKEKGAKERDVSSLSTEIVELLIDELKSISSDMTQGRIIRNDATNLKVTETARYGNGTALLFEDGVFIETPMENSRGVAISCDPARISKDGVRWRMYKNPSPSFI